MIDQDYSLEELMAELTHLRKRNIELESFINESCLYNNRSLFEKTLHAAVLLKTPNPVIINVNEAWLKIFGYTRDEVIGKNLEQLKIHRDQEIRKKTLRELEQCDFVHNRERVLYTKSGEPRTFSISLDIMETDGSRYILASYMDITDRKQAEKALAVSEENYRLLFESMQDAVATVAMDGRIQDCNNIFLEMLGYSREEIHGLIYLDLTPAPWHEIEKEIINQQVVPRGYSDVYEKEYRRKDGTVFPVELKAFLMRDQSGCPLYMGAIIRDITERKKIENGIRLKASILDGINRILREALICDTEKELGETCLAVVQELTRSKLGFINEINGDGQLDALANTGWGVCHMPGDEVQQSLPCGLAIHGIYGRVLSDGKSLYTNAPSLHPDSVGLPEGHPPLSAFLGTPLIQNKQVIGLVGLANKEDGYNGQDVEILEALSQTIVQVFMRKRAERQQRESEEQLKESEQLYRSLFENTEDGFQLIELLYDDSGKLYDFKLNKMNHVCEQRTGLKAAEAVGKTTLQVMPDYIEDYWFEIFERPIKTGRSDHYEKYIERTGRWYDMFLFPYSERQIGLISRDITERKQADEALEKSRLETVSILESISDHFMALDEQLRYVYINQPAAKLLGPRNIVIGKTMEEVNPNINHEALDIYLQVLKEKKAQHFEMFSEQYQRWAEVGVYPSTEGISIFSHDITDRKQAEEALRQSEERFSQAFQASPVMMAIVDWQSNCYIDVNDAWLRAFGFKREYIIGRISAELGLFNQNQDIGEKALQINPNNNLYNYELSFPAADGEIHIGLASSQMIQVDGRACCLHTMLDITQQKQMEAEIARLDRLNLIGEMAASIGHEIRNPMTAVRGFLQMLSSEARYQKDLGFFDIMIEELDRANEIITEYLGMAKDKRVDLKPHNLDEIVRSLYPMIQADANYKEMGIQLELGNPPKPLLDTKEIRQLILNMSRNGLEAMAGRGMLTIGTTVDGNDVVLYIRDQGPGLAPELVDKLGTPFITTKEKGTGLGLAVCYSIAARHKARIDFETGIEGTSFYIRFPIDQEG